jgi:hypothetical protein
LGREAEAEAVFAAVIARLDATGDRVFQAVVRVAGGEALDRADWRTEGDERLAGLGIEAPGWRHVFRLAAARRAPAAN